MALGARKEPEMPKVSIDFGRAHVDNIEFKTVVCAGIQIVQGLGDAFTTMGVLADGLLEVVTVHADTCWQAGIPRFRITAKFSEKLGEKLEVTRNYRGPWTNQTPPEISNAFIALISQTIGEFLRWRIEPATENLRTIQKRLTEKVDSGFFFTE